MLTQLRHSPQLGYALGRLSEALTIKQYQRKLAPLERQLTPLVAKLFRQQGRAYGAAVDLYFGLKESGTTDDLDALFNDAVGNIDIGALAKAIGSCYVQGALAANTEHSLGINFTLKNPRAVEYFNTRGLELLNELNDATRADIKRIIAQGLDEGTSPIELARAIKNQFVSYSAKRAKTVAVTEVGRAYQAGNFGAIQAATDTGLSFEKRWLPVTDPCPICEANANEDWIKLDTAHASGDDHPPAHPNCRCAELYQRIPSEDEVNNKLNTILASTEEKIRTQAYESAYVYDRTGKALLSKDGNEDSVYFTKAEVELFKDATLTHNHPGDRSFSIEDVQMLMRYDLAEIRAVGAHNLHILRTKDASIPKVSTKTIEEIEDTVLRDLGRRVTSGELTKIEAQLLHHHELWTRVAKRFGWDYQRIVT